jgi:hypothetical protein
MLVWAPCALAETVCAIIRYLSALSIVWETRVLYDRYIPLHKLGLAHVVAVPLLCLNAASSPALRSELRVFKHTSHAHRRKLKQPWTKSS